MDRYNAFFGAPDDEASAESIGAEQSDIYAPGRGAGWREARAVVPPPAPTLRPGGVQIGIPPAVGGMPGSAPVGGFFDTHRAIPNPVLGPAYVTDLPSPLNVVTPRVGDWFELGDGTLVRGVDEVERIHAEQQRRMRGEDDPEPAVRVRTADRFKDGVIPRADQIEKGQREEDATCSPYGGWERDPTFPTNPQRSQRYETQITRAPGLDYVVRNPGEKPVKFDGCAVWDPRHQLLEAKGPGYAALVDRGGRYGFFDSLQNKSQNQASRQAGAARGRAVEWHVAEPGAMPLFTDVVEPYPSIRLRNTPAR
jgi:hypothetical protein